MVRLNNLKSNIEKKQKYMACKWNSILVGGKFEIHQDIFEHEKCWNLPLNPCA